MWETSAWVIPTLLLLLLGGARAATGVELRWKLNPKRPIRLYRLTRSGLGPHVSRKLPIRASFAVAPEDLDPDRRSAAFRRLGAETIGDHLARCIVEGLQGREATLGARWSWNAPGYLATGDARFPVRTSAAFEVTKITALRVEVAFDLNLEATGKPVEGSAPVRKPALSAHLVGTLSFDVGAGEVDRLEYEERVAFGGIKTGELRRDKVHAGLPVRATLPLLVEWALLAGERFLSEAVSRRLNEANPTDLDLYPLYAHALTRAGMPLDSALLDRLLTTYVTDELERKRRPILGTQGLLVQPAGPTTFGLAFYVMALADRSHRRVPVGARQASPRPVYVRTTLDPKTRARLRHGVDTLLRWRVRGKGTWASTSAFLGENHPAGENLRGQEKELRGFPGFPPEAGEDPTRAVVVADYPSTELAVLALLSAHAVGMATPGAVWKQVQAQFQDPLRFGARDRARLGLEVRWLPLAGDEAGSGAVAILAGQRPAGWGTTRHKPPYLAMTAAGLSALAAARRVRGAGNLPDAVIADPTMRSGLAGLSSVLRPISRRWTPRRPSREARPVEETARRIDPRGLYRTLFSTEHALDLLGIDALAKRGWYREAALWLLESQDPDGGWTAFSPRTLELRKIATAFALLVLARSGLALNPEQAALVWPRSAPPTVDPLVYRVPELGGRVAVRTLLEDLDRERGSEKARAARLRVLAVALPVVPTAEGPGLIPLLMRLGKHRNPVEHALAKVALARIAKPWKPVGQKLVRLYQHWSLVAKPPDQTPVGVWIHVAATALRQRTEHPAIRRKAANVLGVFARRKPEGRAAIDGLVRTLPEKDEAVRARVLAALRAATSQSFENAAAWRRWWKKARRRW